MTDDLLVEQVCSAHRDRDPQGRIRWSPAWHDLGAEDRADAFERTVQSRALEAALDADGRSSTVRAVLSRLKI
ncbi:MAG: hypothetical protein AB8H79_14535 [Myxococcota bacterium]